MRLLFIRHGDPDYENDTLTEKGRREAALLAERAEELCLGDCYMSPLGRAQHTAGFSLKKLNKTAEVRDWLREFPAEVDVNRSPELVRAYPDAKREKGRYIPRIVWDLAPSYYTEHPELWDAEGWRTSKIARCGNVVSVYDSVMAQMDALLAQHGYVREGRHYRVEQESRGTVTFFCHFGITCALLSHIWNVSPFFLWHSFALLPTSVTELVTEEREKGVACFRALRIGDTSHLQSGKEPPSFACRFCEVFSDGTRH